LSGPWTCQYSWATSRDRATVETLYRPHGWTASQAPVVRSRSAYGRLSGRWSFTAPPGRRTYRTPESGGLCPGDSQGTSGPSPRTALVRVRLRRRRQDCLPLESGARPGPVVGVRPAQSRRPQQGSRARPRSPWVRCARSGTIRTFPPGLTTAALEAQTCRADVSGIESVWRPRRCGRQVAPAALVLGFAVRPPAVSA